jgi:hypothetical protein
MTHKFLKHGGYYIPASSTWTTLTNGSPAPRYGHTAIWNGTDLIVWGGTASSMALPGSSIDFTFNDGARFNAATGVWTPLPSANAPSGRYGHSAVWTGTEMIIWGGQYVDYSTGTGVTTTLNTGARYNPLTNTWTPTSTAFGPAARTQHSAVWAGSPVSQMIVWGGNTDGTSLTQLSNGARYVPSTDSWTSLSTTNAPNMSMGTSSSSSAVWSGNEMIVFNSSLMNGSRYYPISNSWQTMASTPMGLSMGGPTSLTGVWAGSVMAVFAPGTSPSSGIFAFYSPISDYWQLSAATGGPVGSLQNISTVWTGASLIVWGGTQMAPFTYTGGNYSQSTDTWSSLTSSGAPAATFGASVWSGSELLLWGGPSSTSAGITISTISDQGYRYRPAQSYYLYRRP